MFTQAKNRLNVIFVISQLLKPRISQHTAASTQAKGRVQYKDLFSA